MPRTTLDIDAPILRELKAIQRRERRSLGHIVSRLLADALSRRQSAGEPPRLEWVSAPMHALVDLSDKEALHALLDRDDA
jgi:hypothetical protein